MEPLFTNKCLYTKQNLIEIGNKTSSRKLLTISFISLGLLIFICGMIIGSYALCLLGALCCLIYPLYSLWAVRYLVRIRYQQSHQLYNSDVESVSSFYEDHFVAHSMQDNATFTIAYPQVAKVFETKNLFFLMLSTRIGFMLEKQGFEGTTAEEFGQFIRARAVGEGRTDLKKRTRRTTFITAAIILVLFATGITIGLLGDTIENAIPKTFTYGDYSIKLTRAFDDYYGEWDNGDVTVYCSLNPDENLSSYELISATAATYLQDTNKSYGIDSVATAVTDTCAWTTYTDSYEGNEYYNYDYVIKSDGDYWYTEFYCLAKDSEKYAPLFEKWAQTITIDKSK